MSDAIRNVTYSNAAAVSGGEPGGEVQQAAKATTPATPPAAQQASTQEAWTGTAEPPAAQTQAAGPTSSSSDIAMQMAREKAAYQRAQAAVGQLAGPLEKLAQKYDDPVGFFGNVKIKESDLAWGAFGAVVGSAKFMDAAAQLPRSEVEAQVAQAVRKAWPNLSADDQKKLTQRLMGEVAEHLRDRMAFRLQDTATRMMRDSAKSFRDVAADPEKLAALAERLSRQGESRAGAAATASLREAFGIDPQQKTVSVAQLAAAMTERAALMDREAGAMSERGVPSLFRALADHELTDVFKAEAGIRPGSFLSEQVDAVKARGADEKDTLTYAGFGLAIATAVVTFGSGLALEAGVGAGALATAGGIGTSVATGLVVSMPDVLKAWNDIDTARAGESSGTMKAGAGRAAEKHAQHVTVGAGVGMVGGTVAGSAADAVVKSAPLGARALVQGGVGAAGALGGAAAVNVADRATAAKGSAGRNAVERASD